MAPRIFQIKFGNLVWPFESGPYFSTRPVEANKRQVKVDPFPCYPHSRSVVAETVERVEALFPLRFPPTWYLPNFDVKSQTNGFTDRDWVYCNARQDWSGFEPYIVLAGKRTPIHPAMTRYMVAHEYGHVVQYNIEWALGCDRNDYPTQFEKDYMVMRGGDTEYGGGKWHTNVGELIANDFRMCVTGIEVEHWPHPGFENPLLVPEVVKFWEQMKEEYAHRELPAAA